jgi:predicted  nucleic acid-binding Zn-ribbon protein
MAESARTPPCLTHLSDERQRLDACEATLEKQIEELKAKMAELEAALEEKAEALKHSRRRAARRNASDV